MTAPGNSWNGILAPGEEVLWQGQPNSRVDWTGLANPITIMGVFFTGFSMFWIAMAASMTSGGDVPFPFSFFPLFGLPFLAIGLWMLGGRLIYDAWLRGNSWYTLTSHTAFVATNRMGNKTLENWPLDLIDTIELRGGTPGSIIFHMKHGSLSPSARNLSRTRAPGFYQFDEAQRVYGMMREARRALRGAEAEEAK